MIWNSKNIFWRENDMIFQPLIHVASIPSRQFDNFNLDMLKHLLSGEDRAQLIETKNSDNVSPMHFAVANGSGEIFKKILKFSDVFSN